ncbi:hypothetical protein tb265_23940 [Gemmatimonadetes bacterium T265]|nr:hypothetical protein tb265_23940 [Gemmatimonadetes bacterium T265]
MIPDDVSARSPTASPPLAPTLAVVNARVWTADPRRPWADAVVVRGDRLGFVGSGAEARKLTRGTPDVRVIDARGRFLASDVADFRPLHAGAPADFVLADRDLTQFPAESGDVQLVLAVRGGRVVDER